MPQCTFCGGEIDARGLQSHELWCDDRPDDLEADQEPVDDAGDVDHAQVRKDADAGQDEEIDADPDPPQRDVAADGQGGEWTPEPATSDGGTDTRNSGSDSGTDSGTDSPEDSTAADDEEDDYWCGNCETALEYLQKPCPNCGETPAWSQLA